MEGWNGFGGKDKVESGEEEELEREREREVDSFLERTVGGFNL